ncbi:hypothetical protein [Streptomyces sp. NPDC048606]|uniref:DUF6924 domain-containing protein n=1 Tax=Streptomyces sp. NPDC048606 TaxID=3154726 RepID=UPI00341A9242
MRRLPTAAELDEFHVLVVRTDHGDEPSWRTVVAELTRPWGDGGHEALVHVVDDRAWAGADVDDVLRAAAANEELSVVFVADAVTMASAHHALLAVTTVPAEEYENFEEYEGIHAFGREFRTTPAGVHDIHANLSLGNMDFEEFAEAAHEDLEKVYRAV